MEEGVNMTREELKAIIFGDKEVEGMEDVIKQIMDKHGSELTEQKKKAKEAQEATSNLQKQIDEINNAKLTDEEKMQKLIQDAERATKAAAEKEQQYTRELVKLKVKNKFAESGLTEEDYKDFIDNMNFDNEEVAVNSATAMVTMLNGKLDKAKAKFEEEAVKNTPTPPASGDKDKKAEEKVFTRSQDDILGMYK